MQAIMVGSAVVKFVEKALEKRVKDRFQDGTHMLAVFEQVCFAEPTRTHPNPLSCSVRRIRLSGCRFSRACMLALGSQAPTVYQVDRTLPGTRYSHVAYMLAVFKQVCWKFHRF